MKGKKLLLTLLCQIILVLCVTCCATNPKAIEQTELMECSDKVIDSDAVIAFTENFANNKHVDNGNIPENIVSRINIDYPFCPVEFIQELHGMEIVHIHYGNNIERWINLPGKSVDGRHYFDFALPLFSRPVNSHDEMVAMIAHQTRIVRQLNPRYTIGLEINIRDAENELERQTLTLNIQPGIRVQNTRQEGVIRYTLRDTDGSFRYGAYFVASMLITQNAEEAQTFKALREWLDQAERSEIYDLLRQLF